MTKVKLSYSATDGHHSQNRLMLFF